MVGRVVSRATVSEAEKDRRRAVMAAAGARSQAMIDELHLMEALAHAEHSEPMTVPEFRAHLFSKEMDPL